MPSRPGEPPEVGVTLLGRFAVTVDGVPVAEASWRRRHAAAIVKVLALALGHRLHREQVIDLVWPGDTIAAAVPKLHKAAHFARRAIGVPDAVLLRGDQVVLCPRANITVDAVRFEELAGRALAGEDAAAAGQALALYGGEPLPADRYEEWAEARREQLARLHLDLHGRWEAVLESDASDERAHLALMRRHAANGDRHAALRQYERLDRALRQELGVGPGPEASALRDRLLAAYDVFPRRDDPLIGRDLELAGADNSWGGRSTHQRLFTAAGELVSLASAPGGLLLTIDDIHDADDASLRLLHYLARSTRDQPVCIVLAHRPVPPAGPVADTRRSLPRPARTARWSRWRREQLEGDVVGAAERQARTVTRVYDLAMGHAQLVQAGGPLHKFGAAGAAERDMVQARRPLVELVLAVQIREPVQAEQGVTQLVDDVPERSGVLVQDGSDTEDAGVPRLAGGQVGYGHGDVRDGGHSS
jgi:DNA-binding SARP family transcriptional activator